MKHSAAHLLSGFAGIILLIATRCGTVQADVKTGNCRTDGVTKRWKGYP